jgi:hypothetical protein
MEPADGDWSVFRNGGRSQDPESKKALAPRRPSNQETDEERFVNNVTASIEGVNALRSIADMFDTHLKSQASDPVGQAALVKIKGALYRMAYAPLDRPAARAPQAIEAARECAKRLELWKKVLRFIDMDLTKPDPVLVRHVAVAVYATQIFNPERVLSCIDCWLRPLRFMCL